MTIQKPPLTSIQIAAMETAAITALHTVDDVVASALGTLYGAAYTKAYRKGREDGVLIGKSVLNMPLAGLGIASFGICMFCLGVLMPSLMVLQP